jgi:hypothetical protein
MDERAGDGSELYLPNDHIALALGRLASKRLSPVRIATFRDLVERERSTHEDNKYLRQWIDIIDRGPNALREAFTETSQRGQALRSVISFRAFVTKAERDDIFRRIIRSQTTQ